MEKKNITIYDVKKAVENGLPISQCTTRFAPVKSVVPSIDEMLTKAEAERQKKRDEERKEFETLSDQEANKKIGQELPFSEMMKGLKDQLSDIYPKSSFLLLGLIPIDEETSNVVLEYYAKNEESLAAALCESMQHSRTALTIVNNAIKLFCKTAGSDEAEQEVTAMQDIIKSLRERNTPETRIRLLASEIKRLRKAGRLDLMKIKQEEMDKLQKILDNKKRMSKMGKENWRRGLEAAAEKRRKEKQRQKDRNRQQPNFAKMAKQKQQQIKQRQAEKKKKAASGSDTGVRSCSMFNNVG